MNSKKTDSEPQRNPARTPQYWKRYIEDQIRKRKPLNGLQLTNTDLSNVQADGGNLRDANLQGCRFQFARMAGVNLENADLRGVDFTGANLRNAILSGARLDRANLTDANLAGAILDRAKLYRANLESSQLCDAVLERSSAQRANFFDCNLERANLRNTDLRESNLECANLVAADFAGANLAFIQFNALTATRGVKNISDAQRVPPELLAVIQEFEEADSKLPAAPSHSLNKLKFRSVNELGQGDIVGNKHEFEVIRKIGRGGCATVYLVRDLRDVKTPFKALKILDPRLREDSVQVERFKREGEICSKLNHANIVKVFDLAHFVEFDTYYMLMGFVDGVDLGKILRRRREKNELFPPLKGIKIIFQLCSGVRTIHENGIIHRDLKPGNILIKRDGSVIITDFGLSRVVESDERKSALTAPGTVLGTFAYMAPEQLVNANVDERADLYSIGVVMYEMFTGKRPFNATSILGWANVIRNRIPERPGTLVANFPDWLEGIIMRCLDKRPDSRYDGVHGLIEALKAKQP